MSLSYRDAGVDRDAAAIAKRRMRELVDSTRTDAVRASFGSFAGRLAMAEGGELVVSADGVGTKLEVAVRAGRHDTVGEDLVNHCVNDILAEGAVPLAFLDYFACAELDSEVVVEVVKGVAVAVLPVLVDLFSVVRGEYDQAVLVEILSAQEGEELSAITPDSAHHRNFERTYYGGEAGRKELEAQGIQTIGMRPLRDLMRS